jgi:hypothetical protein
VSGGVGACMILNCIVLVGVDTQNWHVLVLSLCCKFITYNIRYSLRFGKRRRFGQELSQILGI